LPTRTRRPGSPTPETAQEIVAQEEIVTPLEIPAPLVTPLEVAAVAAAIKEEKPQLSKSVEQAITLPSDTPYTTYDFSDDPDMPGGDYYTDKTRASALYKENPFAELALMHDLLMQSPWSEHSPQSEKYKYQLAREFEQRYADGCTQMSEKDAQRYARAFSESLYQVFDDDDYFRIAGALQEAVDRNVYADPSNCKASNRNQCGDCRPLPFDFTPWGTQETFENWAANRPVRKARTLKDGTVIQVCEPEIGQRAWMAQKVSRNQVPFDLRWYDADLYFAYAALPRLFRMHIYQFAKSNGLDANDNAECANAQLMDRVSTYAQQLDQCKNSARNDWKQCVAQYLIDTFSPHADDPAEIKTLLGSLWYGGGGYLSTLANKRRMITLIATLALMEQAANGQPPMQRADFVRHVVRFVELISGIYRLSAAVPVYGGLRAAPQRDWLVNSIGNAMQQNNEPFIRVVYMDYFENLVLNANVDEARAHGYTQSTRKTFIAAESLRWTLWYLSQKEAAPLEIPYDCLVSAVRLLHSKVPRDWYVIDADVLRKFAIINYDSLLKCADISLDFDSAKDAVSLIEQRKRDIIEQETRLEQMKRDAEQLTQGRKTGSSLTGAPSTPIYAAAVSAQPPAQVFSYLERPVVKSERAEERQTPLQASLPASAAPLRMQQCALDYEEARQLFLQDNDQEKPTTRSIGDYVVVASDQDDEGTYRVFVATEFGPRGFIVRESSGDNTLSLQSRINITRSSIFPVQPAKDYATLDQLLSAEIDNPPAVLKNLCDDSKKGSRFAPASSAMVVTESIEEPIGTRAELVDCSSMSEDDAFEHVSRFAEGAYVVRKSSQMDDGYRVYISRRDNDNNDVTVLSFARNESGENPDALVLTAIMVGDTHYPVAEEQALRAASLDDLLAKALPNVASFRNVCFDDVPPAALRAAIERNPEGPSSDEISRAVRRAETQAQIGAAQEVRDENDLSGSVVSSDTLRGAAASPLNAPNESAAASDTVLGATAAAAALLAGSAAGVAGATATSEKIDAAPVLAIKSAEETEEETEEEEPVDEQQAAVNELRLQRINAADAIANNADDYDAFVKLRRYQRELIDGSNEKKAFDARFEKSQGAIEYPLSARQRLVEQLQKDNKQYIIAAAEKSAILAQLKRLNGVAESADTLEKRAEARAEIERLENQNPELIALFELEKDPLCNTLADDEEACLNAGCEFYPSLSRLTRAIGFSGDSCYDPDTQTPGWISGANERSVRIAEPTAVATSISIVNDYEPFAKLRRLQSELMYGSAEQAAAYARYRLVDPSLTRIQIEDSIKAERDALIADLQSQGRTHIVTAASQAGLLRRMKQLDRELREPVGDEAPGFESDAAVQAERDAKQAELDKLIAEHPLLTSIFEQERSRDCEALTSKGQDACFSAGCEFHPSGQKGWLGRRLVGDLCYDPDKPPSTYRAMFGR
jgi:hypothetical protein